MRGWAWVLLALVLFLLLWVVATGVVVTVYDRVEGALMSSIEGVKGRFSDEDARLLGGVLEGVRLLQERRRVEVLRTMFAVLAGEVVLSGLVVFFYVGRVRGPVLELARLMEEFRGGEVPAGGGVYEVRRLVAAYTGMLRRLERYEQEVGDLARFRGWKEMARVCVHEVRNLLSPVRMVVEQGLSVGEGLCGERLGFVLRKLGEVDGVLARLRDLAHLPEARPGRVVVGEVVREVVGEFPGMGCEVCGEVVVRADGVLLAEVVRNLCANARDTGALAGVRVWSEGDEGVVEVWDRGPGIPEEEQERVWEPGVSGKEGGMGLGLALVRLLVGEMGGRVVMWSRVGEGTRVEVRLPGWEGV